MVSEKVFIDADELLLDSYRLAAQVIELISSRVL